MARPSTLEFLKTESGAGAVLGVGAGDEVVVPAFTYVASANVVEQTGARTVFCDIEPSTYNVDPASLERAITARTKATAALRVRLQRWNDWKQDWSGQRAQGAGRTGGREREEQPLNRNVNSWG